MARSANPWFWTDRNGWYVNKDGQRHFLGEQPIGAPAPRKVKGRWSPPQVIVQAFHALMAEPTKVSPKRAGDGPTVGEVFEKFLDWCQTHRASRTYEWYRDHLQDFLDRNSALVHQPAIALRPYHVIEWIDSHGDNWGAAYRRGGIIAVQRPFNWAEELGYIPASPIKRIKKPQPPRRDNPITPEDFSVLVGRYAEDDPFRDLLTFAWFSGCRPQEVRHIERRHINLEQAVVVIPKEEAKGKKRPRVIHLNGQSLGIITRLIEQYPEGKLFRNHNGLPWKRFAIANRFQRLMIAIGTENLRRAGIVLEPLPRFNRRLYADKIALAKARKEHRAKLLQRRKEIAKLARKHGKGFALYDLRHGFATRKLVQGVDPITLAELMGHRDATMVAKVYQHLNRHHDHLKKALEER